jgi:hypothetical protein
VDCHGAVSNGSRLLYAAEAKTRSTCRVLSFGFDSGGEPTSVCSQGGGGILAEAGLGLAEVHEGSGLLGEGESGDREGIERGRPITV